MTPEEQAWYDQWKVVHNIAQGIVLARANGDATAVATLRPYLVSNINTLRALSTAADAASLTAWDNFVLNIDNNVGTVLSLPALGLDKALAPIKGYLIGGGILVALYFLFPLFNSVDTAYRTRRKR